MEIDTSLAALLLHGNEDNTVLKIIPEKGRQLLDADSAHLYRANGSMLTLALTVPGADKASVEMPHLFWPIREYSGRSA